MNRKFTFQVLIAFVIFGSAAAHAATLYSSCYRHPGYSRWICTTDEYYSKEDADKAGWRKCRANHLWLTCKWTEWKTEEEYRPAVRASNNSLAPNLYPALSQTPTQPTLSLTISDSASVNMGATQRTDGLPSAQDHQDFGLEAAANSPILQTAKTGGATSLKIKSFSSHEMIDNNEEETTVIKIIPESEEISGPLIVRTRDEEHAADLLKTLRSNGQINCWSRAVTVNAIATGETAVSKLRIRRLSCIP